MAGGRDGRSARWEKHRQERRQVILDAAIAVLEDQAPGETFHVQDIADRSGLHRTVIYRHFEDRTDLDLAVQREICKDVGTILLASAAEDGTPREVIHTIVEAYVGWAAQHPSLIAYVERDLTGGGSTPFTDAVRELADLLEVLINTVVGALDADLSQDDIDLLDPLVFGLIGGVYQSTQRWLSRSPRTPAFEVYVANVAQMVWHQIAGLALDRGITVPDVPLSALFASLEANAT